MRIWQADFYRRPSPDESGQVFWDLLICDASRSFQYVASCLQSEANSTWLASQLQEVTLGILPDVIQVFRPQSLSLMEMAGKTLGVRVEATRRTAALKQWLQERNSPVLLDQPPPLPLPENLLGEQWRFATLTAGDIVEAFCDRPIPIVQMPDFLLPINLGLASTIPVPGVVIYGGRQSMRLARWLQEVSPVSLSYIAGAPDGLVLSAGLVDRWILATFEDKDVVPSAQLYEQRKQQSRGLHFLLVQPDDSGMTYSGVWLLRGED